MRNSKSLLMIAIMITGVFFITNTQTTTAAINHLDIKAGDTFWYDVKSFPTFGQLIDFSHVNEDENSTVTISSSDSLVGSELYVKVLSTQKEGMSYGTGSGQSYSSDVPTTDISVGLITGAPITFTIKNKTLNTVIATVPAPAGLGLPIPFLFGTTTYLNVTGMPDGLAPIPFALNDDFTTHAAYASAFATEISNQGLGTLTVTDTTSEFALSASIKNDTEGVQVNVDVSWDKTTGAVQKLFAEYKENGVLAFNAVDIRLRETINEMVKVEVGDTFSLDVSKADFTYSTSGIPNPQEVTDVIESIKTLANDAVGTHLIELEVKEVHGMYYRVEGSMFNGTGKPRVNIPDGPGEAWMVGFGRLGPGMPLPLGSTNNSDNTGTSALSLNILSDSEERRMHAAPGFVVSEDWKIYNAWDKTLGFLGATALTQVASVIDDLGSNGPKELLFLGSKSTNDPVLGVTMDAGETTDGGYQSTLTAGFDVKLELNTTDDRYDYYDSYDELGNLRGYYPFDTHEYSHFTVQAELDAALSSSYTKHGDFDKASFTFDGSLSVNMLEEYKYVHDNDTYEGYLAGHYETNTWGPASISISNLVFEVDGTMTRINPIVDPVDSPSSSETPGFSLPGFELFYAIASVSFVTLVITRKRKN